MQEMYGTEISQGLLSKITDKLLPVITDWRNRSLEPIYPNSKQILPTTHRIC